MYSKEKYFTEPLYEIDNGKINSVVEIPITKGEYSSHENVHIYLNYIYNDKLLLNKVDFDTIFNLIMFCYTLLKYEMLNEQNIKRFI